MPYGNTELASKHHKFSYQYLSGMLGSLNEPKPKQGLTPERPSIQTLMLTACLLYIQEQPDTQISHLHPDLIRIVERSIDTSIVLPVMSTSGALAVIDARAEHSKRVASLQLSKSEQTILHIMLRAQLSSSPFFSKLDPQNLELHSLLTLCLAYRSEQYSDVVAFTPVTAQDIGYIDSQQTTAIDPFFSRLKKKLLTLYEQAAASLPNFDSLYVPWVSTSNYQYTFTLIQYHVLRNYKGVQLRGYIAKNRKPFKYSCTDEQAQSQLSVLSEHIHKVAPDVLNSILFRYIDTDSETAKVAIPRQSELDAQQALEFLAQQFGVFFDQNGELCLGSVEKGRVTHKLQVNFDHNGWTYRDNRSLQILSTLLAGEAIVQTELNADVLNTLLINNLRSATEVDRNYVFPAVSFSMFNHLYQQINRNALERMIHYIRQKMQAEYDTALAGKVLHTGYYPWILTISGGTELQYQFALLTAQTMQSILDKQKTNTARRNVYQL